MLWFKKNKPTEAQANAICAPVDGEVIPSKKIKDETFSKDMMGKGFGIIPANGNFVAPISGKVTLVNNHAFGIKADSGIEVLVHIGIDTVSLKDANVFVYSTKVGKKVCVGDKIVTANLDAIKAAKLDTVTPVVALSESLNGKTVTLSKEGTVKAGEPVLTIQ